MEALGMGYFKHLCRVFDALSISRPARDPPVRSWRITEPAINTTTYLIWSVVLVRVGPCLVRAWTRTVRGC